MGYPMAVNLRSKLSPEYTLIICDVNESALQRFQQEIKEKQAGPVEVVSTGAEAVRAAVCMHLFL
jgi:hypothetical protein